MEKVHNEKRLHLREDILTPYLRGYKRYNFKQFLYKAVFYLVVLNITTLATYLVADTLFGTDVSLLYKTFGIEVGSSVQWYWVFYPLMMLKVKFNLTDAAFMMSNMFYFSVMFIGLSTLYHYSKACIGQLNKEINRELSKFESIYDIEIGEVEKGKTQLRLDFKYKGDKYLLGIEDTHAVVHQLEEI